MRNALVLVRAGDPVIEYYESFVTVASGGVAVCRDRCTVRVLEGGHAYVDTTCSVTKREGTIEWV